jgi:hypothetical protein
MSESFSDKAGKSSSYKMIVVIVLVVLMIPVVTVGILYAGSENFRQTTQRVMAVVPGPIGNYFSSLATPDEQTALKHEIARHYITLDEDRIVDKLLMIRAEDEKLYNELLILLNRENPRKMSGIADRLQLSLINDDTLQRILEEVNQDRLAKNTALSAYLNTLSKPDAIAEIERMFSTGEIKTNEMGLLFQQFSPGQAAFYLRYLNSHLALQLRNQLQGSAMLEIDKQITAQLTYEKNMLNQAGQYENKGITELVPLLTTEEHHSINDLALIFHHMNLTLGGKILSRAEDPEILQRLYKEMMILEGLPEYRQGKTIQLTESVRINRDYLHKVNELVNVYQRMNLEELAPLVERMMVSNTIVRQHIFSPEEQIVITEEQLVLDVLSRMKPTLISDLLSQLSTPRAVLLSQKLYGD